MLIALQPNVAGQRMGRVVLALAASAGCLFSQHTTSRFASDARSTPTAGAPMHIFGPGILATGGHGEAYVAVPDGVFRIDPTGVRTRIAGLEREWRYSAGGLNPRGVALDAAGNLYLADAGNNRIRKLTIASGAITTVAGNGVKGFSGDGGPATSAELEGPTGVAVDRDGNLYIADGMVDGHDRIRMIAAATGVIATVAGNGSQGYSGDDGPATLAQLSSLGGLAVDTAGNLYIADNFNNRIRRVSLANGIITTVAGSGVEGFSGDGGLAVSARLDHPLSVAVDAAGDLFIADSGNYRVRKLTTATGIIFTTANGRTAYPDAQHGFPCSLAVDAEGNLYIADSGISRIRKVSSASAAQPVVEAEPALVQSQGSAGFKINVTYDTSVPAAAQSAFNSLISTYESVFTSNITVNVNVTFGDTGLGESETAQTAASYSTWRAAMIANANANPGNSYAVAAAASLPAADPIGNGDVLITTANARALGMSGNASVDTTLTFSNSVVFEYTGVAASDAADFLDVAAHELDEGLAIGSALTGLADNAQIPAGDYFSEDYFRFGASGIRAITTNPDAVVYFSYNGGSTNVAQFNQAYSAEGDTDLDRNDWIYGNSGCPAATPHVRDAIACLGQVVPVGAGPEIAVLNALGFDSSASQTITFNSPGNVAIGVAPFSLSATASSGLTVSFTSTTTGVCTVSGSTVTILATGTCSITASQAGNGTYSAATPVTRSFTVTPLPAAILAAPANGAGGVSLTPKLSWSASSGATSYDVYFGTSSPPPLMANVTATSYAPAILTANTTYFWQVVAMNSAGSTSSTIFSFSTFNSSCTFSVTPPTVLLAYTGGSSSVSVTAGSGCAWTATSSGPWLTITSGSSGSGNGTISFTAGSNPGAAQLAYLKFANQSVGVMQGGSPTAPVFNDVPSTDPFFDYVSLMSSYGITAGCQASPPLYCPSVPVTRAQMSVFVVRGLDLATGESLTYPATAYFTDMPASGITDSEYFPFVQRIAQLGITVGCQTSPALYCPDASITQAQMAVFAIRTWMLANNLTTFTYPPTPYFTDVPSTDIYFSYIQKMAQLGFWTGCTATTYCENSAVTRDQMAPIIMRSMLGTP